MKDIVDDGERIQRVGKQHGATASSPAEGRWEINGGKVEGIKRDGKKGSTNRRGRDTGPEESREGIIIRGRKRSRLRGSRQEVGKGELREVESSVSKMQTVASAAV